MARILKAAEVETLAGRVRSLAYARSDAGNLVVVGTAYRDADGWLTVALDRHALPTGEPLVVRVAGGDVATRTR